MINIPVIFKEFSIFHIICFINGNTMKVFTIITINIKKDSEEID